MRLIDADKYKHGLNCAVSCTLHDERSQQILKAMLMVLDAQPTAYDLDKVVEQLKKEKNPIYRTDGSLMSERQSIKIDKAIEVVKGGGVDGKKAD